MVLSANLKSETLRLCFAVFWATDLSVRKTELGQHRFHLLLDFGQRNSYLYAAILSGAKIDYKIRSGSRYRKNVLVT